MTVDESRIRELSTEAVFERGRNYREEGRIVRTDRLEDVVTAEVQGSRLYDVRVDLSASDFDPRCTCPYDRSAHCKHVVAVLLQVADEPPTDESRRIETALERAEDKDLRTFLREACTRDPALRDRFLARFGPAEEVSAVEYEERVTERFEAHTDDYPVVVEAIDFSDLFEVAEAYQDREHYSAAAAVYRGLVEGIDEKIHLVDAAVRPLRPGVPAGPRRIRGLHRGDGP